LRIPPEPDKREKTIAARSGVRRVAPHFKEKVMTRKVWVALCGLALAFSSAAQAQMGMDMFRKPAITKVFHPVVGKGALYETSSKTGGAGHTLEIAIVGKESVDGQEGYWMQFVRQDSKGQVVGKSLITVNDFQFHKMIIQPPGQPAMEMPMNMSAKGRQRMDENMADWHSVGTESITVPAGTFSCEHWKNEKTGDEAWTSDKVTPFGMVKEVGKDSSMTLTNILDSVPDRITGPVKQFDMQQMMQQMQQQHQQQHP
jgi:hypothetical protein